MKPKKKPRKEPKPAQFKRFVRFAKAILRPEEPRKQRKSGAKLTEQ